MSNPFKLGIFASESGWHFQDLARAACSSHDNIQLESLDFRTLNSRVHLAKSHSIRASNIALQELDCILVRIMPAGSLEQIVFRMDALNRLQTKGIRIVNQPRAVEIAVDKYLSLALLAQSNISVPRSGVSQTSDDALRMIDDFGGTAVMKPLFGSLGNGLHLVEDSEIAKQLFEKAIERGEVIYLQERIDHGGSDFRFFVIGENVWSIKRTAKPGNWITNVSQGGTPTAHQPTTTEIELAIEAAKCVECEIAGVDVAIDQTSGKPYVLEVNAAPGWQAIASTLDVDFAAQIVEHCVKTA